MVIESTVVEKKENADLIYLFIGILRQGLVVQTFLELAIILSLSSAGIQVCTTVLNFLEVFWIFFWE